LADHSTYLIAVITTFMYFCFCACSHCSADIATYLCFYSFCSCFCFCLCFIPVSAPFTSAPVSAQPALFRAHSATTLSKRVPVKLCQIKSVSCQNKSRLLLIWHDLAGMLLKGVVPKRALNHLLNLPASVPASDFDSFYISIITQ
jgi:hypothetical protein